MEIRAPCVILVEPQLAENIGAAARAMANFGLEELRLVRPRAGWPQTRAWQVSSGAHWPLEGAKLYASLAEAIADLHLVLATTARPREAALPVMGPREGMARLRGAAAVGQACGLVFGNERAGLGTDDIVLCQGIVTAPVGHRFRSLNLAQAVAICAYEWAVGADPAALDPAAGDPVSRAPPASLGSLHGFYDQLETELDAGGFFHPPEKKPSMVRNLRVALGRAAFSEQEVATMRGVVTALTRGRGRVLAKLAAQAGDRTDDRTYGVAKGDAP